MSNKSLLSSSSIKSNTPTAITGVTIERITSTNHQLSLSSLSSPRLTPSNVPLLIKVKKEPPQDEIKEYAANAMSELLGWYGYEKVDSRCTRGLNLDHFASLTSPKQQRNQQPPSHRHSQIIESNWINNCNSSGINRQTRSSQSPQSRTSQSPSISSISVLSNKECDVTQVSPTVSLAIAPASPRALELSDSASDTPDSSTACSWCGRSGETWESSSTALSCKITNNSGRFCSEACFAAGRRAAFKRARTCDWCRHVRHSVSYVDFQDGESQLQFCSDKCLNQYKMNIFCRETQAHLALHGLASLSSNNSNASGGLITPELWLRDCRSPPPSSVEDETLIVDDEPSIWPSANTKNLDQIERQSNEIADEKQFFVKAMSSTPQQTYNFDNTSNDTFNEETEEAIKESLKDEEERQMKKCKEQLNLNKSFYTRAEMDSRISGEQAPPCSLDYSKESPTDYPHEGTIYLKDVRKLLMKDSEKIQHHSFGHQTQKISKSPVHHLEHQINFQPLHRSSVNQRPFLPHPMPMGFSPRMKNFSTPSSITMEQLPSNYLYDKITAANSQAGLLPPVTVLVPYPIPIPIPLPIPIPIPLFGKFFHANNFNSREAKQDATIITGAITTATTTTTTITTTTTAATNNNSNDNDNNNNNNSNNNNNTDGATATTNSGSDCSNVENNGNGAVPIGPEDLSQRGKIRNSQRKNIPELNQSTLCSSLSSKNINKLLPILPISSTNINSRPLRKRRRQSGAADQVDMRHKRRSKFVPV